MRRAVTRRSKADSLGKETKVPENDWIEIGAFAKPAEGKKYGKQIYSQQVKISSDENTYTFITNEKPDKASARRIACSRAPLSQTSPEPESNGS